jgi:hypothetical protein
MANVPLQSESSQYQATQGNPYRISREECDQWLADFPGSVKPPQAFWKTDGEHARNFVVYQNTAENG